MKNSGGKTCERIVANGLLGDHWRIWTECGQPATFYLVGVVGAVGGRIFVCTEHKKHYSALHVLDIEEYWIKQAEAALEE